MSANRWLSVLFLGCAAALLGLNLGGYDVWPADEPRYAQVAREMMQSGDWLSPRINNEPYMEKPPLLFWSIALASLPQGDVSPLTARIPSLISALVTAALTGLLAWRMFGARAAFWSAAVLATGLRFWWQARTGQIDMVLTACVTTAVYHLWRWDGDRRNWRLAIIYGALALGVLAKGPVALVFPLLLGFFFFRGNPDARRGAHWILGLAAVAAIACLWYIPARMAVAAAPGEAVAEGIGGNLFRNIIGRVFLGVSKAQAPWYYIVNLPADLFPWSLFLPWTLVWMWRNRYSSKMHHYLWCWTVPALIFFSLAIGKRALYILPLYPAFAIILAMSVLELMDGTRARWRCVTGVVFGAFLLLLGAAPLALPLTPYKDAFGAGVIVFSVVVLATGAGVLVYSLRSGGKSLHAVFAGAMLAVFTPLALFMLPAMNPYVSARDFCAPVRGVAESGAAFRLYSLGFSREEYVFYAKHFHEPRFVSLVGMDRIPPEKLMDAAELQRKARKLITKAVEDVPVADMSAPTAGERAALAAAIQRAVESAGGDREKMLAFEDELRAELNAFAAEFFGPEPAFLFVMDDDWRWMRPLLAEETPGGHVLRHQQVGRRDVLLLANDAGRALAEKSGGAPSGGGG